MSTSYTFSPLSALVAYSGTALAFLSFQMHYAFSNQFIDGFKQPVKMTSHFGTKRSSKVLKVHPVRVMRFRKQSFSHHCSAIKRCLYAFTLLCQWMDGQTGMCWTSINCVCVCRIRRRREVVQTRLQAILTSLQNEACVHLSVPNTLHRVASIGKVRSVPATHTFQMLCLHLGFQVLEWSTELMATALQYFYTEAVLQQFPPSKV
jgi:hypothetical protein